MARGAQTGIIIDFTLLQKPVCGPTSVAIHPSIHASVYRFMHVAVHSSIHVSSYHPSRVHLGFIRPPETAVRCFGIAVQGPKALRIKAQTSQDERESSFTILQLATTILQPYYNPILQPHTTTSLPCSFVAKCNFHIFNNKNTCILLTRDVEVAFCYKTAEK